MIIRIVIIYYCDICTVATALFKKDESKVMVFRLAKTAVLLASLFLPGCSYLTSNTTTNIIHVVAGENPWGVIANELGGKYVKVDSLINSPNADPHLYESSAQDAAKVAQANIVIVNGLGYDSFLNQLLFVDSSSKPFVIMVNKVLKITQPNSNPHLWYDVLNLPKVATSIKDAYCRVLKSECSYFEGRLLNVEQSLIPVDSLINTIKLKFRGVPIAYTERVAEYLLNEAGLKNLTPAGFASSIENGVAPSPEDIFKMNNLIEHKVIKLLIYNTQTISPATLSTKALATAYHVPLVGVSETIEPQFKTYANWQLSQLQNLFEALSQ